MEIIDSVTLWLLPRLSRINCARACSISTSLAAPILLLLPLLSLSLILSSATPLHFNLVTNHRNASPSSNFQLNYSSNTSPSLSDMRMLQSSSSSASISVQIPCSLQCSSLPLHRNVSYNVWLPNNTPHALTKWSSSHSATDASPSFNFQSFHNMHNLTAQRCCISYAPKPLRCTHVEIFLVLRLKSRSNPNPLFSTMLFFF